MTSLLSLPDETRRIALRQASTKSGMIVQAVEKDWWVTLVLKALFETEFSKYFIFKGGTSLSKGWNLIGRFSEDIDIALSPEAFGMEYKLKPSKDYRTKTKKEGCLFTSKVIKSALEAKLNSFNLYNEKIEINAKPIPETFPDTDPQVISIVYRSLFEPLNYIVNQVKVEFSVRSLKEPNALIEIQSILWREFPQEAYKELPFSIRAATPHKTLIEKMCLLHEKFASENLEKLHLDRQSRHLYDIAMLSSNDILNSAITDEGLFDSIVDHRKNWIKLRGIDYETLQASSISFLPPNELMPFFEEDYEQMRNTMIYTETKEFAELMDDLKNINLRVNNSRAPKYQKN